MTAKRRNRIEKSLHRRLSEFEDFLFLLRDNIYRLRNDSAHLMVIAGALRSLICYSSRTEGLLWRLADELKVSDAIQVWVAGKVNADTPLNEGLRLWLIPLSRTGPNGSQAASFRNIVKNCHAAYAIGNTYTYEELIKAVAQQVGIAHSDQGIEPKLSVLEELNFSGHPSYNQIIASLVGYTLQVGERVLRSASINGYPRKRKSKPLSLSVGVVLKEKPLKSTLIATWRFEISDITIKCYVSSESFIFSVYYSGDRIGTLEAKIDSRVTLGRDAFFSVSYSHENGWLQALGPMTSSEPLDIDLGYVDIQEAEPSINSEGVYVATVTSLLSHSRLFSQEEINRLPEVIGLPPTITVDG